MIELEIAAGRAWNGWGNICVYRTDQRLVPGTSYRVTIEPADAPRDEPAAWAVAARGVLSVWSSRESAECMARGYPDRSAEPLYRRPQPGPELPATQWVPTSRFL